MLVVEGQLYLSLLILLKLMDSQNNEAAKELADHLVAKIGKQGQERVYKMENVFTKSIEISMFDTHNP